MGGVPVRRVASVSMAGRHSDQNASTPLRVVITGASSGIGEAVAERFRLDGARLLLSVFAVVKHAVPYMRALAAHARSRGLAPLGVFTYPGHGIAPGCGGVLTRLNEYHGFLTLPRGRRDPRWGRASRSCRTTCAPW